MLFNSYTFLFIFLPLVMAVYRFAPPARKNLALTLASYVFYGYWNLSLCSLLLASTAVNYWLGSRIHATVSAIGRRQYLTMIILFNLGLLGFFKYADFFIASFQSLFPDLPLTPLNLILPVGISFFTFQGMSYGSDIYRRRTLPAANLVDFACYIAMFPQLIAGPIVRFNLVAEQLVRRTHTAAKAAYGIRRFIIGLARKVLIADTMAVLADRHLLNGPEGCLSTWIGMVAFSLQIYFDFSGYSDMAIGLGHLFGFDLPENFDHPYQARGLYDFWKRWHMTLSGWLKDYLYIPLGGSRVPPVRWIFNILLTFLLCGLWHGANWTFVAWGGYHGLLLILERPFRRQIEQAPAWLTIPLTNLLVIIGWALFKAPTFSQAMVWLKVMFPFQTVVSVPSILPPTFLLASLITLQAGCWIIRSKPGTLQTAHPMLDTLLLLAGLASFVALMGVDVSPFLYYQF